MHFARNLTYQYFCYHKRYGDHAFFRHLYVVKNLLERHCGVEGMDLDALIDEIVSSVFADTVTDQHNCLLCFSLTKW